MNPGRVPARPAGLKLGLHLIYKIRRVTQDFPCPKSKEVILRGLCGLVPDASIRFLIATQNTSSGGVVSTIKY